MTVMGVHDVVCHREDDGGGFHRHVGYYNGGVVVAVFLVQINHILVIGISIISIIMTYTRANGGGNSLDLAK